MIPIDITENKYQTSLRTSELIAPKVVYDEMPKIDHLVPSEFRMDFSRILRKPFLVATTSLSTTNVRFTELVRYSFPSIILDNAVALVPFITSSLFRVKSCVNLQLSGTPSHQGTLLVAALPYNSPIITNPNQILSAPHVFLNANESTSVCLEVPMYSNTSLLRTSDATPASKNYTANGNGSGMNFCDIVVFIMNPLACAVGASTTVSLSLHAVFDHADFYVPKNGSQTWTAQSLVDNLTSIPTQIIDTAFTGLRNVTGDLIDIARQSIRSLTGFHNPNNPKIHNRMIPTVRNFNNADIPVLYENMDNHALFSRIYDDYYFRTTQDEMNLKYLTSKPVFVGRVQVTPSTVTGSRLFSYPITPMVEAYVTGGSGFGLDYYSPLRTIYESSRFWRGSLKLHIQSVCTNFHYTKMVLFKDYSCAAGLAWDSTNTFPTYNDIHNLNLDTLEFSGGGQIQTIDLPFCSTHKQLECTKDFVTNAVSHGVVHGYCVQPLVYNNNVPTTVYFNIYISGGDDLEFSGYALENVTMTPAVAPTSLSNIVKSNSQPGSDVITTFIKPKSSPQTITSITDKDTITSKIRNPRDSDTFEPQSATTMLEPSEQDNLDIKTSEHTEVCNMSFQPNVSIRDYLRMMNPQQPIIIGLPASISGANVYFPISRFFNVNSYNELVTSFRQLSSLYLGISGGIKLKFRITGAGSAAIAFAPPGTYSLNGNSSPLQTSMIKPCSSYLAPTESGPLTTFSNQSSFDTIQPLFPSPYIETPSHSIPTYGGGSFMLECAIPNMNPANFVGSANKWHAADYNTVDDMGAIYIRLLTSSITAATTVNIQPQISLSDEARLGFQSYSPKKTIVPVNTSGGRTVRNTILLAAPFSPQINQGIRLDSLPTNSVFFNS